MALNYQDVIRDVHDPVNHALQISGTIQAAGQATVSLLGTPTVMVGTPTLFAVVNTSAAGVGNSIVTINPRVDYIGLMSVSGNVNISNPTLYAVVNTSAAGVGNSIVTVANPDFGINAGVNSIGFATVNQVNQPALVASSANIGSVSILGGVLNTVSAVTDITNPIAIKGNVTLSDSKGFIGLTSIQGNVNLNAGINNIGFATVAVSTPTLYAVVNTGAVGTTNSMVTINPRTDYFGLVSVSGNVAVSSLPALTAGAAFVGIVTVANPSSFTGNVTLDAGSLTGIKGNVTLSGPLPTGTLNIGSVSILGGTVGVSSIPALAAGVNSIGFASVTPVMAWPDPKTYIGLVTITGSLAAASGNVTITDGKTFIGSVSVTGNVGLNAGVAGIGFATVNVVNQPALVASSAFIGLVTVANTVPVTGTFWQATQPVSGTVAATQSGTWDEVGINDSGNSITVDNAQLSVVGTGTEAAAMRVTIASDSTGVLSVDDNGGVLTVDGTVTADLGATDNAVLDAIAASTAAIETAVEGTLTVTGGGGGTEYTEDVATANPIVGTATMIERDDVLSAVTPIEGDNIGLRGTAEGALWTQDFNSDAILADTTAIKTAVEALDNAISGSEMQVDVVSSALPTGASTLAEQQSQTTHLATVAGDTTSIQTAVELIDDTVATLGTTTYTEAATKGLIIGAVRRDADTTLADTTNEVTALQVDAAGRLKVEAFSGETLPVSLTSTTVTGTVAVTQSGTWDEVGINDSGNSITVDYATTGSGTATGALRVELPTNGTGVVGLNAGTNAIGKLAANSGVDIGDVDVTSSALPTGASTLAEQQTQTTALQLIDNSIYIDDADWTADTSSHTLVGGVTQATPSANTDGDVTPLITNALRELRVAVPESDLATAATTHVKKYYTNAGAVTDGIIWSSAAGKRWYVTDIFINVSAAATVTLEDDLTAGDAVVWKAELAANSGWSHHFGTPLFSGEDAADLLVTTTAGNVYITVTGYEI